MGDQLSGTDIKKYLKLVATEDCCLSFRLIYNHYYERLFRQAMYYFNDFQVSADLVSDVFVSLWQSRKVLDKINDPDAYLFISLKYTRAKYIEKIYQGKKEVFMETLPETVYSGSEADQELLGSELEDKYQAAMNKLPPRCAEVFRLVREEKKKYSEAAEILGISVKTVDNQMNKAVRILYKELKEHLFLVM